MDYTFKVCDTCLTASGGSYIVKYSAELTTSPGTGKVEITVANTIPDVVDEELMKQSVEQVCLGVAEVLKEHRLNGALTLIDLVIHDVDCKPYRFRRPTVDALRGLGPLH